MRWLFDCFAKIFRLLLKHLPAVLLYLNTDSPTCLLFDHLIKIFHFSVKDLGKLCDDHNLTSKCWKGTFSQRFLFINANIKTLNRRLIFASKFQPFQMHPSDLFYRYFLKFMQHSQQNTCARVSETLAQVLSSEFCEIFIFYKTPPGDCFNLSARWAKLAWNFPCYLTNFEL